jgi:hypothetical protein
MDNPLLISLAVLATYRLTILIVEDYGPFYIFDNLRAWAENQAEKKKRFTGFNDAIHCEYCTGIWMAVLCGLLIIFPSFWGDLFLVIFGLAGGQIALERITK